MAWRGAAGASTSGTPAASLRAANSRILTMPLW
jgi:hypothetical protein